MIVALLARRKSRTVVKLPECKRYDALLIRLLPGASVAQNFRKPLARTPLLERSVLKKYSVFSTPSSPAKVIRTPRVAFLPASSLEKCTAPLSSSEIRLTSRMVFPDRARNTYRIGKV